MAKPSSLELRFTRTRRRPEKGREWLSDCGRFKIARAATYVPPAKNKKGKIKRRKKKRDIYYGLIRGYRFDGKKTWDFAAEHEPYNTREQAEQACLRNFLWWERFVELGKEKGSRVNKLKALVDDGRWINRNLPFWVKGKCDDLLRMHMPYLFQPRYNNPLLAPDAEPEDAE